MDSALENRLMDIIKRESSITAIKEWVDSQKNSKKPLYNYRFDHVELVVKLVQYLANQTGADYDRITMAGWLHDVAKPGIGGVRNHGELSAEIAQRILTEEGIDSMTIEKVCDSIRKHVGLTLDKPLESLEAQILWDADKIVKLGMVGFIHFLLNGIRLEPDLNIYEISARLRDYLSLVEKITKSMNTASGRKIAEKRFNVLVKISELLDKELNIEI